MKTFKTPIFFVCLSLFFSCNNINNTITKERVSPQNDKIDASNKTEKIYSLLDDKIDVQNIKSQLDEVTTTFLSKEEILYFLDKKKNNYFGSYTLIKKNSINKLERIGEMIVYDSINPHVFEKETDEFIEITLNKSGVNLYDGKLKIGMTLYELFELLGKDYTNNENSLIYSKHDKIAFFKIDNDLVSKIKIGIYKKGTDPKKVLENSNW